MKIPIVNEQDEIIGYKDKKDVLPLDINRDAGLFILNPKNQILLGKRSSNKKLYPNRWATAVAGTVEEGETYEACIVREAQEEIGLIGIKPIFMYKYFKQKEIMRMSGVFKVEVDDNYKFTVEPNEISEIKWFSREEINELFISNLEMFTPNFPDYYKKFLEYENKN